MTFAITAPPTIETMAGQNQILAFNDGIVLTDTRGINAGINPPPANSVVDTITIADTTGTFSRGPQTILASAVASHATVTGSGTHMITISGPLDAVATTLGTLEISEPAGSDTLTVNASNSLGDSAGPVSVHLDALTKNTFHVVDTANNSVQDVMGIPYVGPVAGVTSEFADITPDNLDINAFNPNVFINSGSGNDAIDTSAIGGTNVIDGGGGSNFITGGSGQETFYLDDRNPSHDIWTTIVGLHSGDDATIWGVKSSDPITPGNDVLPSAPGLDFSITPAGKPIANLTLRNYSTADLSNGRLQLSYGHTPDLPGLPGADYLLIHAT